MTRVPMSIARSTPSTTATRFASVRNWSNVSYAHGYPVSSGCDVPVGGWSMLCAQAQQGLEGGHGGVAAVVPEGELVQVDLQVLGRGAVVGAGDPGFEVGDRPVRPGQDQRAVGEPVMLVDRAVVVAGPGQLAVSAPPVGMHD